MAKTTAPLLSFSASGQIGKTQVYGSWKGRSYVRRHVTPSNPQTAEQSLTRNAFSFLQAVFKIAPPLVQAPWELYAKGIVMTARNAFAKFNLPTLRTASDLTVFTMSPGAKGGLPPSAVVVTPGNDQLSVAVTPPAVLPTDWTITSAIVAVIPDQDPQTGVDFVSTAGEDLTDPYTVVLTGLESAALYQVFAWLKWLRPDGAIAYSPSIQSTGLTT